MLPFGDIFDNTIYFMNTKRALIIIDMQKGCFTGENPKYDSDGVINRINSLSEKFRKSNSPVIFIQQDSSVWNRFVPNSTEWEILSELKVSDNDISINKTANDAFYQSNLTTVLEKFDIKDLFITGFATEFCVNATIQSALTKDFNVTVVKDGHTTASKPHLDAKGIIEHYNWVWQNLIPTKGMVKLLSFEEL